MKDTKRQFFLFNFYDRTGIKTRLENEARKGWLLEKMTGFGWVFRRIEPADIHYTVTYFPGASAFDPGPSDRELSFREFCEHSGWKLAASSAQMQIYYNESPHPVPIETDPELELETIHRAAKKGYLPMFYLFGGLAMIQLVMFFVRLSSDFIGVLSRPSNLVTLLSWLTMIALISGEAIGYLSWHKKARAAAEEGSELPPTKGRTAYQYVLLAILSAALITMLISLGKPGFAIAGIVTLVFCLGLAALMIKLSNKLKKLNFSAKANSLITFGITIAMTLVLTAVICFAVFASIPSIAPGYDADYTYEYQGVTFGVHSDPIPMRIEDIMNTTHDKWSTQAYGGSTFLMSEYEYSQRALMDGQDHPSLSYTVVDIKLGMLYNNCKNAMLGKRSDWGGYEYRTCDPSLWGAKEAYRLWSMDEERDTWLLCYDSVIVEFSPRWEITAEQMAVAGGIMSSFGS
ncbi:MAG: DUF2812 domain-containing protein [Clostridia bacterium]|nr:DUF2812 domain-containing protein [Clostridia bacterium]